MYKINILSCINLLLCNDCVTYCWILALHYHKQCHLFSMWFVQILFMYVLCTVVGNNCNKKYTGQSSSTLHLWVIKILHFIVFAKMLCSSHIIIFYWIPSMYIVIQLYYIILLNCKSVVHQCLIIIILLLFANLL